jgi:hypothetical protein
MPDTYYPSVDLEFIIDHVKASGKLAHGGIAKFGSTTTFIIDGPQAIYEQVLPKCRK